VSVRVENGMLELLPNLSRFHGEYILPYGSYRMWR